MALEGLGDLLYFAKNYHPNIGTVVCIKVVEVALYNLHKTKNMALKEIDKLAKLSFQKQKIFAYLACERVYPNYVYFSTQYNFGDTGILKDAITFIYENIFSSNTNIQQLQNYLQQVDINIPFPDNFNTFYATIAMNASGVIYESLNLLNQKDTVRILNDISTMCTDLLDLFIQERDNMDDYNKIDFELTILNDPLMKKEVEIQKGCIAYLAKIQQVNTDDIELLLKLQENGTLNLLA